MKHSFWLAILAIFARVVNARLTEDSYYITWFNDSAAARRRVPRDVLGRYIADVVETVKQYSWVN